MARASVPTSQPDGTPDFDVPVADRPRHIAVIMDGNGRWATERGRSRAEGHRAGAQAARRIVEECGALSIGTLTLYSFSMENWKRPADEVDALMGLLLEFLPKERDDLLRNNVRFQVIGDRAGLAEDVIREIELTEDATADCSGLHVVLAINYSSRHEITRAARHVAAKVRDGVLSENDVTEAVLADHLYTRGIPDPDLLIRTSGEHRISNYLLWQISYSELHVTDAYWPDFDGDDLRTAIRDFAGRQRRFGDIEAR
ncbi:MAG: di-trans,poly-cis-decaprenylcistransferase [Phycisphaerae bacterium]|nr:di-trans,poly-cis-decaprenylcistransferase [Phycisphaerae bacterium]|tara:strand:- start:25999 stop:26769 length:771 start_codon:yes stop_codon:yes gene_type:complete